MNNNNKYKRSLDPKLSIGMTNDLYHDLAKYLNEMFKEMSSEKDKKLIMQNIGTYYESINKLLIKHTNEHPRMSKP